MKSNRPEPEAPDPSDPAASLEADSERVSETGREMGTWHHLTLLDRDRNHRSHELSAADRDGTASSRDEAARRRDARDEALEHAIAASNTPLANKLELLRRRATKYRARAAADRERSAKDRHDAAEERARLELRLRSSELDGLTGAYRREMGSFAISQEVARARRSDGRFVLAFVDVDGMKTVNDRDGHAAGDRVLQIVVSTIRSRLRSFDPVVRYGGDEFLCGLSGTGLDDARERFDAIAIEVEREAGVGISVGLAELEEGETPDGLAARADALLLQVKAAHHRR